MNPSHSLGIRTAVISGTLGALIAGGTAWAIAAATLPSSTAEIPQAQASSGTSSPGVMGPGASVGGALALAAAPDVVERAMKSVVSIKATKAAPVRMGGPWGGILPFQFGPPGAIPEQEGMGSGVVVRKDGIVLTNHHVVAGAKQLSIVTADGRALAAEVVGSDAKTDLAVLRVKEQKHGLEPIALGSSAALRLGEPVLAIGNPFGVGQTVTQGIVSAKGRADLGINAYEDFIQTDAAINPGNSGGALVNLRGELVGINTAILSRSGGNVGIGFAIPTDMAQPIMKSLIETGRVDRGWLGVGIQELDQDLASALDLRDSRGVLVSDVEPGSPAQKAGLSRGDVITKVNGQAVATTGQLRNLIAIAGAKQRVTLGILRQGRALSLDVTLGAAPLTRNEKGANGPASGGALDSSGDLGGIGIEPLDDRWRERLDVPRSVPDGLVVTNVAPGSVADKTGLRPGDVILEIDRQPVTASAFAKHWRYAGEQRLLLLVYRQGRQVFLATRR